MVDTSVLCLLDADSGERDCLVAIDRSRPLLSLENPRSSNVGEEHGVNDVATSGGRVRSVGRTGVDSYVTRATIPFLGCRAEIKVFFHHLRDRINSPTNRHAW